MSAGVGSDRSVQGHHHVYDSGLRRFVYAWSQIWEETATLEHQYCCRLILVDMENIFSGLLQSEFWNREYHDYSSAKEGLF